jgi:hypothetical protein
VSLWKLRCFFWYDGLLDLLSGSFIPRLFVTLSCSSKFFEFFRVCTHPPVLSLCACLVLPVPLPTRLTARAVTRRILVLISIKVAKAAFSSVRKAPSVIRRAELFVLRATSASTKVKINKPVVCFVLLVVTLLQLV